MDVSGVKQNLNNGVEPKNASRQQSAPAQPKADDTQVLLSSLGLKLREAQRSVENAKLNQQPLFWDKSTTQPNTNNREGVDSAKWDVEHLPQSQLETIALAPGNVFSDTEKVAAYETWHTRDQAQLTNVRRSSLQSESAEAASASFDKALIAHIDALSPLGRAMLPEDYSSQATSKFEATLNEVMPALSERQPEDYYAVMVEDIFAGNEPEVRSGVDGMSLDNLGRSHLEYLTRQDRTLLADMYEYAEQNDVDFTYLRRLASDLGSYRKHDDGKVLNNFNQGHFDAEGQQLKVSFTEKDQATINDLLDSEGMHASAIDKGFVSFMTEPGLAALSHVGSYQFLQHMVEVTGGTETSVSVDEFREFRSLSSVDERYVLSTSDTSISRPEPDVVCKNGKCEVTEKGRQNGVSLQSDYHAFAPALDFTAESMTFLSQLHVDTETRDNVWYRWLADD